MVLFALMARPGKFRHCRGLWFIDNTAALMCLVRGRSAQPDLEHMAHLIHVIFVLLANLDLLGIHSIEVKLG